MALSKKSQSEARGMAQALLSENIVFLDTETTGLGNDDEIIEISIIDKHGLILLDTLVKPIKSIPASSSAVHNITNWQVRNAPAWSEIHQNYRSVVKNKTVIIYNRKFDNRLLRQTCGKYGLATPRIKSVCLMELYSLYAGVLNRKTGGYKWFKLTDAIDSNNIITDGGFHRALGDVVASRKLLYFIAGTDEYFAINESEDRLISSTQVHCSDYKNKHEEDSVFFSHTEKVSHDKTGDSSVENKIRPSSIYLLLFLFIMVSITIIYIVYKIY